MANIKIKIYIIAFMSPGIPAQTVKIFILVIRREVLLMTGFVP